MAFMGYPCARALLATERRERFESLRLDEGAKGLLREQFEADHWQAAIYLGGFERLLLRLSRVIRPLLGRGIEDIFETTDIAEQRHFMERRFPRKRWQSLLRIIGSATMLNALLYRGAFPRAERGRASSQHLAAAFEQIFANIRCRDSFFLQLLFLGEIRFPEAVPGEGQGEVLTTIRAALEDIDLRFVLADITRPSQWTSEQFDAIFLSDVPSFLGKDAEARFLQEIRPALSPLGTAITRESVRAISPDLDGFRDISPSYAELSAQETTQLWTIKVYQNQP